MLEKASGRVNKYKSRTNFNLKTNNMQDGYLKIQNNEKSPSGSGFGQSFHGNS